MKSWKIIALISLLLTLSSSSLMAANAEFYKKAAKTAAQVLGEYLSAEAKLVEEDATSCNYSIIVQQGEAGQGSRTVCNMYLTYYARTPHPHHGNFKKIASLQEKWSFKEEYGEKVCERKFVGDKNELIRVKANYVLPGKGAKVKMVRTMAFIDFYAGSDQAGYFSFSINRNFPVAAENISQLEGKGHGLVVSDSEKIIEAIRAGLSGKNIESKRPPVPDKINEPEKWLTLSPAQIVKTHLQKIPEPVSSTIFATLVQIGDFKEVEVIEDLEIERLRCMTAHEILYCITSQRLNQSGQLFVGITQDKGVIFSQLSDGQISFSPAFTPQEALAEACKLASHGLPDRWFTFKKRISPPEQMVLRALSTLSMLDESTPPRLGFSLGQVMLEMGNPVHASSIGIMPDAARNAMFASTLNRNEIALALLKLSSNRLIKRSYLAGQHYFSLTSDGIRLCRLFGADGQTITIWWQKKPVKAFTKPNTICNLAIFSQKDLAMAIYLSPGGDVFSGLGSSIGHLKMNPAQAMQKLIKTWQ